ncbi:hypothetical protein [Streptomyces puniciscabiei]|uniref:hypothetical protein n=1 Tax=Streptomyces puniciscabiei TaxID=164348 RepID=UPI003321543F
MRKALRAAALASAAALIAVGATAVPASAAEMQPMSKHTGKAGCFSWSWSDGWVTTTVYWRNTCDHAEYLYISWNHDSDYGPYVQLAGEKNSASGYGSVTDIADRGRYTG